jgi:hypothetical protein
MSDVRGEVAVVNHLRRPIAAAALRESDAPAAASAFDFLTSWAGAGGRSSAPEQFFEVPARKTVRIKAPRGGAVIRTFVDTMVDSRDGQRPRLAPLAAQNGGEAYVTSTGDIHVGMITTRWVGGSDDFNIGKPNNAIQGMPYVDIHNQGTWTPRSRTGWRSCSRKGRRGAPSRESTPSTSRASAG